MTLSDGALVIALRCEGALAAWRPLRLEEPPGPALLRHDVTTVRTELNPPAIRLERLVVDRPRHVFALYDSDGIPAGRSVAASLKRHDVRATPVRRFGTRLLRSVDAGDTRESPALLPLLTAAGIAPPAQWTHPIVFANALRRGGGSVRLGVVLSRIPEPGLLSLADVGRDGVRPGAPPAALPHDVRPSDLPPLLDAFERGGAAGVLLVDDGGDVATLAEYLVSQGRLAAWFGVARRPVPSPVQDVGVPMYVWLEPEDADAPAIAPGRGCAFVPVAVDGEDVPAATARLLALRRRGWAAVVPRIFTPLPGTTEWRRLAERHPLRLRAYDHADGSHVLFDLPGWERAMGPELIALWTRDNRPPAATRQLVPPPRRTYSLQSIGTVVDGYLADRAHGAPSQHASELVGALLAELPAGPDALTSASHYPFVAWRGESLLALVDRALDSRLRRVEDAPPELLQAMRDAVLGGGKRIRPVLSLIIAVTHGASMESAIPAALALEWLHAASLVQDDLPAMDDDRIRRHRPATHLRHGEGLALLAADALVALAFEDVAALAADPAVGGARAAAMVGALARALGIAGLVGGQARDLLARESTDVDPTSVLDVHRRKTAPLFELAAVLATTLAGVPGARATELTRLLGSMGVAFQIVDDVLDATPDNTAFGRPAGSDARRGLPTFASLVGTAAARRRAEELLDPRLAPANDGASPALMRLARFVLDRRS